MSPGDQWIDYFGDITQPGSTVVEAQPVMRSALGELLAHATGIAVAAICATGAQLLGLLPTLTPDVIVGDPNDFDASALAALIPLLQAHAIGLLLYTNREQDDDIIDALMTSASGHVSRRSAADVLLDGIRAVGRGERYVDDVTVSALGRAAFNSQRQATRLTERENDVLALLAEGLNVREIAKRLYIGEGTVKTHIKQIYRKLEVRTRGAAVAYALRAGLVA